MNTLRVIATIFCFLRFNHKRNFMQFYENFPSYVDDFCGVFKSSFILISVLSVKHHFFSLFEQKSNTAAILFQIL